MTVADRLTLLDPNRPDLQPHLDRVASRFDYQDGFSPQLLLLADEPSRGPSPIAEAFARIEDLADEAGHEALLAVAGGELGVPDLDPAALALVAWLEHPEAFNRAHARQEPGGVRRFREFPGRSASWTPVVTEERLRALTLQLGQFFERRGRTRYCRVELIAQNRTHTFRIRRGRPLRCDAALEAIEDAPSEVRESWATYRPRGDDLAIYDPRSGRLKLTAPDAATLQAYVCGFGEMLFGERTWFRTGNVVSLGPLVELGRDALRPTPGITSVELVSVDIALGDDLGSEVSVRGADVFAVLARYSPIRLVDGILRSARLKLRYAGGGRGRTITLAPPDQATWDHRRDDIATRTYLEARGFVAAPATG